MRAVLADARVQPVVNLTPNPGMHDLTGYTAKASGSIALSMDRAYVGDTSILVTKPTGSAEAGVGITVTGLTVGRAYTLTAFVFIPSTGGVPARSTVSAVGYGTTVTLRDQWAPTVMTFTPTNATRVVGVDTNTGATAGVFYLGAMMVTPYPYAGPYGDGSMPGWRWLGTPHASPSVGYPRLA